MARSLQDGNGLAARFECVVGIVEKPLEVRVFELEQRMDGRDDPQRAELIAERLRNWKPITNA